MVPFLLIPLHRSPLPCLSVRGKTKAAACWQPPGLWFCAVTFLALFFRFVYPLEILAVLLGRKPSGIFEHPPEMRACHKACLFRHAGNAFVGLFDHVLRRFDAYAVDVFDQAQVDGLFEQTAEVIPVSYTHLTLPTT